MAFPALLVLFFHTSVSLHLRHWKKKGSAVQEKGGLPEPIFTPQIYKKQNPNVQDFHFRVFKVGRTLAYLEVLNGRTFIHYQSDIIIITLLRSIKEAISPPPPSMGWRYLDRRLFPVATTRWKDFRRECRRKKKKGNDDHIDCFSRQQPRFSDEIHATIKRKENRSRQKYERV